MKITTFNIGRVAETDRDFSLLQSLLKRYAPDFIIFQEYPELEGLGEAVEEASGLKLLRFEPLSESHVAVGKRMGIALFGRGSAEREKEYTLYRPDRVFYYRGNPERFHEKRFFKYAYTDEKGEKFTFITGHGYSFARYGLNPDDFPEIFRPLEEWILSQAEEDTIVVGDFNVRDVEHVFPDLVKTRRDVYAGQATRPKDSPVSVKSDYLFLPESFLCLDSVNENCGTYEPAEGYDHNYLQAEIVKKPC